MRYRATPKQLEEDLPYFQWRVLQDAWTEATRAYWLRRASDLEAARPRLGDYPGKATPLQLAGQYARLTEAANACRARATRADASVTQLHDTLADVARPSREAIEQAEQDLRAALDTGDHHSIRRLTRLIDQLTTGAAA